MLSDPTICVVLNPQEGYTLADIIIKIRGKYVPIEDGVFIADWTPTSNSREFCYPADVPVRLSAYIQGIVHTVLALGRENPGWRYFVTP